MESPGASERARWAGRLGDRDLHRRLLAELPLPPRGRPGGRAGRRSSRDGCAWRPGTSSVAAVPPSWRCACGSPVPTSACSRSSTRVWRGTGNVDVTAAIATDLGAGYAFGVEFVELSLGDAAEQREAGDLHNVSGLHGNAIVTRASLGRPGGRPSARHRPRLVRDRLAAAPRRRSHGRRRHGRHRRGRGGGRVGPPREPRRPRTPRRADGGAVAGGGRAGARRSGRRRRRLQHARRQLCRAVRPPAGARDAPEGSGSLLVARALRTALRRGPGARIRMDRRQRRRADDGARLRRAPRPRADQVGLAVRARPRGPPRRRRPGGGLSDHHLVSVGVRLP